MVWKRDDQRKLVKRREEKSTHLNEREDEKVDQTNKSHSCRHGVGVRSKINESIRVGVGNGVGSLSEKRDGSRVSRLSRDAARKKGEVRKRLEVGRQKLKLTIDRRIELKLD